MKEYDLYGEMQKIRGDFAEFGNVELSTEYVKKLVGNKPIKLLDIGTNLGSLPYNLINDAGIDAYGVDCRQDAIEKGKKKYDCLNERIWCVDEKLSGIENDTYDIVTMFDVLEHIPDVDLYIKEQVFRVLRPGGLFIFQTPNKRINIIYECFRTRSLTAYKSYHCSLQTPKSLKTILQGVGAKEIVIEKNDLNSEFNRNKLKRLVGPFTPVVVFIMNRVPLAIFPNMWGHAMKPNENSE